MRVRKVFGLNFKEEGQNEPSNNIESPCNQNSQVCEKLYVSECLQLNLNNGKINDSNEKLERFNSNFQIQEVLPFNFIEDDQQENYLIECDNYEYGGSENPYLFDQECVSMKESGIF